MALTQQQELKRKRRLRYANGYVIQQEGTEVVERLIRNGEKTRYGVKESLVPNKNLSNLSRDDAEDILENQIWNFYGYNKIDALTIPAKIYDTNILFNFEVAIKRARSVFDLSSDPQIDFRFRKKVKGVRSQDFFDPYIILLEQYVEDNYGGRKSLIKRVNQIPPRNVNAETTG